MTNLEPILKVENLTKIFISGLINVMTVTAVKDVSFTINQGEVVSLVGESGSGKSTASNIILKLIPPTSGRVFLKGEDIYSIKKRTDFYKKVQVVFQDPYASFNLVYRIDRVLYNAFNLREGSYSKQEKKKIIVETLSKIGLNANEVLGRYPHQLSGGQLQRFLLARVLIIKPILLIADEPTSMIDASSRAGILNLLEELRKNEKFSVLFITHDIAQAQYISNRVCVMKDGEIIEKGLNESVFGNPQHPYTRDLLNSVPDLYSRWEL
ncbi:MAG: ABC transporter ATP-binding protein [Candidatus Hodarchaeales archaeon]|jgi:peptide/nickel transport system ATP-binding protein